ncbi:hypothetical protein V1264_010089 [Littorina saxatilis]
MAALVFIVLCVTAVVVSNSGSCSCSPVNKPKNCLEAKRYNSHSGVVLVYPQADSTPIQVYCDQDTDGGGWLVFQRRQDGFLDFYRNWKEYQNGFGDVTKEFWLGLDALLELTSSQRYALRVDLMKFNGTKGYATYSNFKISDSSDNYRLHFDSFTGGNAGDSLSYHNNRPFTTYDEEHDTDDVNGNCAVQWHGAWWYGACHYSNLNGRYKQSRVFGADGVTWYNFDGGPYSLKFSEMKMRPV